MEKRRAEKRAGGGGRTMAEAEEEEDYGDYVTRCICDYKHDDGYMICCDECSVWQHVECMQVDPKNLPENYLCELCEPRPVDKRRAQKIQQKKREDISDAEEANKKRSGHSPISCSPLAIPTDSRKPSSLLTSTPASGALAKKRKKKGKLVVGDLKAEPLRKSKRERPDNVMAPTTGGGVNTGQSSAKKQRRRGMGKGLGSTGNIQSLLTAASLLEDDTTQGAGHMGGKATPTRRKSDLWNGEKSPWTDAYETADQNLYTEPVRAFLVSRMEQLKSEEVVYTREEYMTTVSRPHHQCVLAEVCHRRKGVVLQAPVPQDELVMECKGKIATKQDILADLVTGSRTSSLWKHKPCPFVYLYDKIANLDLCIDSRNYGNLTRFIRRSCCPNAEVRHFFVSSELHFGVYALNHIATDEEVTLPFDFRYDKCDYPVECGCGQTPSVCLVARGKHPATLAYKVSGGVASDDDYHHSLRQHPPAPPSLQRSHSHVFLSQDEDSNSSWTSTASSSRKRPRHPTGPSPFKGAGSCGPSRDGSSDSEEEDTEKPRKSLSREERKTEQVWRVFEKLEASAQRRRQQLLSEGSHESDPLSSPGPTIHSLNTRVLKDRRSSSSSRSKAQLLPGVKMRLSSVSSTDPLSPYDPCEPFSPPTTPGLAPPPPSDMRSPLLSPTSPTPHFQAAPQLHPKYLFADFALPWKKAILKQWESEQLNGHASQPRSYWTLNQPFLDYHVTSEMMRPRVRGCLKHRWLKHYNETSQQDITNNNTISTAAQATLTPAQVPPTSASGSDKENVDNLETRLSHKKRVLLRWQGSEVTDKGYFSSRQSHSPTPPVTMPPSEPTSDQQANPVPAPEPAEGGCGFPLFDEFSDSEDFARNHDKSSPHADSAQSPPTNAGADPDDHAPESPSNLPKPDISVVGVASGEKKGCVVREEGLVSGDMEVEGGSMNVSGVSDISSDLTSKGDETPPTTGPQTPPPPSGEATPTSIPAGVSDISSDNMDMASPASQSADIGTLEGRGQQQVMETESELVAGGGVEGACPEVKVEPVPLISEPSGGVVLDDVTAARPPPLDSLSGGVAAPPSPLPIPVPKSEPSTQATPSKTPGKRKITYTEYRSRARKPAEKKVVEKVAGSSPPPPSTPGTPSFLTHPFFTSPYTTSLQLTAMSATPTPLLTTPTPEATAGPHFEPVSPEDGDHTPKLGPADDLAAVSALSNIVPGSGVGGVASPLTYSMPQGSALYPGYTALHQAPPPSGLSGGYVGGEAGRWGTADDPRNRQSAPPISSNNLLANAGGVAMALMQSQAGGGVAGGGVPMATGLQGGGSQALPPGHGSNVYPTHSYYQVQQQNSGHAQPGYPGPAPTTQRHGLQAPPPPPPPGPTPTPGTSNYY